MKVYIIPHIILYVIILIVLSSFISAYNFDYPTSDYYNGKENEKVDIGYIKFFEEYYSDLEDNRLEIEFTTRSSRYGGYTYCHSFDGRIEITIYRDGWINYNYGETFDILEHELKHAYQCRILREYPNHGESFYE